MGSLTKQYKKEKLLGKVYTPSNIVNKILDDSGFKDDKIPGKFILDPACGDGRFLKEIVKRIIKASPEKDLRKNLQRVYGWDIDEDSIKKCKLELNKIVKEKNIVVDWNIKVFNPILEDLKSYSLINKFDFIFGNPPYIRIQNLSDDVRKVIQKKYSFCKKGSTDIYIAFFELSYNLLNENGICGFITPNTFFYTETARPLRSFLAGNQLIKKITNYREKQIFKDAKTYNAITIFNKKRNETFIYETPGIKNELIKREINFNEIKNTKIWRLSINKQEVNNGKKLKEICEIHVGITTLCDKAYIFNIKKTDDDYVTANTRLRGDVKIEKKILRPIIKGSTLKSCEDPIKEYILFPYKKVDGKNKIIIEGELKKDFPFAYKYLVSIKDILDKRDNGKPNNVAWYAYGRNQALDTSFGKKIIFSPMNRIPNFILYKNTKCTIYSGYFIKYKGDYDKLLDQLNSSKMSEYISISSRDFRGGWKAYSKKILESFIINVKKL